MKRTTDIGTTTVDECTTEDERMDKAFEQILEIAFDAGLLVFMTDEDNSYTQRVLIERPVEDESEEALDDFDELPESFMEVSRGEKE